MLLLSLIMLSLNTFSQNVTKDSVVTIPVKIARQVAKDLVEFDGLKLEHKTTLELIKNLDSKINTQSLIVKQYEVKDGQWKQMITNYDAQILAYKNMTNDLQKDLRKSKVRGFYNKFGLSVIIGGLTYLYITK